MPEKAREDFPEVAIDSFVPIRQVCQTTSASRSTIYSWIELKLFPPPVKIGPRRVAWRKSDIDKWMASRR